MAGCAGQVPVPQEEAEMTLSLSSTAFKEGDKIPVKYTCDGEDISPPLAWGEPPQKTQAFVLIVDDPDAPGGVFTHWVLFNIPGNVRQLGKVSRLKNVFTTGLYRARMTLAGLVTVVLARHAAPHTTIALQFMQ
jgi:phosphatidylethanolamine-binding protein (PEBP) family uncharacterized protein